MAGTQADATSGQGSPRELTLRGILLGGMITLLFTAANVYLGLKVALTFATSIPAAVISMAVLRWFRNSSILENNIVQTIASAAGTLAAIIFVLPGLVMIGWWQGFPYWTTAAITGTGGILGVLFSVPLRRALIVESPDLPYPEGRAAAEVLRIGSGSREGEEESARGLAALVWGSVASAGFAILTQTKLVATEAAIWFRAGAGATGISGGLSFALMGVGHLVGISVGAAMALGMVLGWWILLPILTAQHPLPGRPGDMGEHDLPPGHPLLRRRRDRRRRDLDLAQDRRAGDRRHRLGDGRQPARARAARCWRSRSGTCRSAQALLAAQITQAPDQLAQHRRTVPPGLNMVVMRCLEKRAADRWQSAAEMIPQLDAMSTPSSGTMPVTAQTVISTGTEKAIRRGHPLRVAGLFGVASLVVIAIVWQLVGRLGLPDWVLYGAVGLLLIGLPVMLMTGLNERQRAVARTTGMYVPAQATGVARWLTWRKALLGGGLAFGSLAAVAAAYTAMRLLGIGPVGTLVASGVLKDREPLVLADFENRSADSTLGPSLTEAFRVDLSQSPTVRLLDASAIADALQRMERAGGAAFPAPLARELAEREGIKGVVMGQIDPVGKGYVLSASLVSAGDGKVLTAVRETAQGDGELLGAIDRLSKKLRERVGESLVSIRENAPLEQVTTGSLVALKKYTEALRLEAEDQPEAAIPLLQEAVTIDTGFAMAYRKLAVVYGNLGGNEAGQVVGRHPRLLAPRSPARAGGRLDGRLLLSVRRLRSGQGRGGVSRRPGRQFRQPHRAQQSGRDDAGKPELGRGREPRGARDPNRPRGLVLREHDPGPGGAGPLRGRREDADALRGKVAGQPDTARPACAVGAGAGRLRRRHSDVPAAARRPATKPGLAGAHEQLSEPGEPVDGEAGGLGALHTRVHGCERGPW